ncbi:MAG: PQQ-dependent sugar dehydrogenase, partial [Allosphingosinicella sp.]
MTSALLFGDLTPDGLDILEASGVSVEDGDRPRLEGLQVIWRQSPKLSGRGHYGHRIAFGPDGKLYISNGDR